MSNRIEIETKYDIERKTNSSKFDPTAITVKSLTATGDFMIAQKQWLIGLLGGQRNDRNL